MRAVCGTSSVVSFEGINIFSFAGPTWDFVNYLS